MYNNFLNKTYLTFLFYILVYKIKFFLLLENKIAEF